MGVAAAIAGSAVLSAGVGLATSSSNSRAIRDASNQTANDNAASRELQGRIYDKNNALLSPYNERGNIAGSQINALLGLSGDTGQKNAFDMFRDSTGYQFRFDEGMKGLNALNAARGSLDSGAAVKSALQYGQNIGSQEFGNYLGYLGNQQGVGLAGASAVAGVGQNYANGITNLNNQNSANAWNTAQAKAQNNNALYSNLSSSFGLGLGALSDFGGGGGGSWVNPSAMTPYSGYGLNPNFA